jgi:HlyD family secretion protein
MNRYLKLVTLIAIWSLPSACSKPLKVQGATASVAIVESTVSTTSSGTVDAEQQAVLGFGVTGRVAKVSVQSGAWVTRGQLIAELENTDLKSVAQDAERERKRAQELFDAGLVSRVALDDALRAYEIARANLDRAQIRAPFNGMIAELNLEVGELAQAQSLSGAASGSSVAVRIVDLKPRLIKGRIDELDLAHVAPGQNARIKIPAIQKALLDAQVTRIVPFVNSSKEQDRTAQVELKLMGEAAKLDPRKIPVGASADIEIVTSSKSGALCVPARTVLGTRDSRTVFLLKDGRAIKTAVKTGVGNYERIEILEGLSSGDVVIYPPQDAELTDQNKVEVEIQPWP